VAEAGQENIETVHEPKPIQAADTLWGQGRRAMKDLHGPQTQVVEGAYAIKVSMSCPDSCLWLLYWGRSARTTVSVCTYHVLNLRASAQNRYSAWLTESWPAAHLCAWHPTI